MAETSFSKGSCLFVVSILVGSFGLVWYFFIGPQLRHDKLVKHGVQSPGRLLSVEETGTTINDSPELELAIEFQRKDGALDTSTCTFTPTLRTIHLYQPGTQVTAAYDPEDPDEITVVSLGGAMILPGASIPNSASDMVEKTKRQMDSLKQRIDSMTNEMKRLKR